MAYYVDQLYQQDDLSKMRDDVLNNEYNYVLEQCRASVRSIEEALNRCSTRTPLAVPLANLHDDYRIHTARFEAICEEMQRRYIP